MAFAEIKKDYFNGDYIDPNKAATLSHEKMEQIKTKFGLNDAQFLYLCEMVSHYNMEFKAGQKHGISAYKNMDDYHPTWCNAYAGYTYYLFSGETDFFGKGLSPKKEGYFADPGKYSSLIACWDLTETLKGNGWKTTTAEEAQKLANKGIFVVGVTPDHVAVVAPGVAYKDAKGIVYPAVAQQGRYNPETKMYSNYLYGVTSKGTMANAWRTEPYKTVVFYYKEN